jgi:hypothetical protein
LGWVIRPVGICLGGWSLPSKSTLLLVGEGFLLLTYFISFLYGSPNHVIVLRHYSLTFSLHHSPIIHVH